VIRSFSVLILCIASLLFLCSCGASVNLSPGTIPRTPKPEGYKIQVYQKDDTVQTKYTAIGLISVEDSGVTLNCSYEVVFNKALEKARTLEQLLSNKSHRSCT
jgi:hypothetical protein